jgi:hypothetical protein
VHIKVRRTSEVRRTFYTKPSHLTPHLFFQRGADQDLVDNQSISARSIINGHNITTHRVHKPN